MGTGARFGGRGSRALRVVVIALLALGLIRTLWYAAGPAHEPSRLNAQVHWLNATVEAGAAADMQGLFPEGEAFTLALTAIATARAAEPTLEADRASLIRAATQRIRALEGEPMTATYPPAGGLPHGIFLAGWHLQAQVALADLTSDSNNLAAARRSARVIADAVGASTQPFLEAYPGQTWPVDTVVAMAGVAEVGRLTLDSALTSAVTAWVERARLRSTDGLLPHHVAADGITLDGPRGTSSALALAFLPSIDTRWASTAWDHFTRTFVTRTVGAVGTREFPRGSDRAGDIDSGPLIAGVSLSATAVTVGAARANGSADLAGDLLREAEIAGVPVQAFGQRRYAAGVLPIGDAFLAWARSVPQADESGTATPQPLWWVWSAPWLIGIGCVVWLRPRRGAQAPSQRPRLRTLGRRSPGMPEQQG